MWEFYTRVRQIPGITVYGDFSQPQRCPIVALNVRDYDSGLVSDVLAEEYGIATRPGAHCAPLMHRVLGTMEQGAVRFSFSHYNTKEEIDKLVSLLQDKNKILDEIMEERAKNHKQTYIVVGIDSAIDGDVRCQEMAPYGENITSIDGLPQSFPVYGDILGDFIVSKLIPTIDQLYRTNKVNTIGGSSMGGLFAYYLGMKYPDVFKNSICFSPAFCLYQEEHVKVELEKLIPNNNIFPVFFIFTCVFSIERILAHSK